MRVLFFSPWLVMLSGLTVAEQPKFPGATPAYKAWVAARLAGNPEGLATDNEGNLYATLWQSGRVVRIDPKGKVENLGFVPSEALGQAGITTGAEFGRDGQLYIAYMWHYSPEEELDPKHLGCRNSQDVYTGIYKLDTKSGVTTPFVTKRDGWPGCFPDDITFDAQGNIYVTDLSLSGIWKFTPQGKFTLWSTDPLLQYSESPYSGFPEGANDLVIARDGKSLIVVTDGNPGIVRVPILPDGSAGKATLLARDLTLLDGLALDELGNIYVAEPYRNELSVYSPDGSQRIVIATADTASLDGPTSLVYRNGTLCTSNSGMTMTEVHAPRSVACISGFKRPGTPK